MPDKVHLRSELTLFVSLSFAKEREKASSGGPRKMKFLLENKIIANIPVIDLYNTDSTEKRPLVLFLHGYKSRKENHLESAYHLAKEGFYAVLFDGYCHGELETGEFKSGSDLEKGSHIIEIMLQTTGFFDRLIDAYADHRLADNHRVGLIGTSLGGQIIFNYISGQRKHNVKAAVPILGTPVWLGATLKYMDKIPGSEKIFDQEKLTYIKKIQPSNYLDKLKDFPLLMLNGEKDPIIPVEDIRDFYGKLNNLYSSKDSVQFVEYENLEHRIIPDMIERACGWFERFL
jgi:uncharacterized protein